jgi:hypothetical protein
MQPLLIRLRPLGNYEPPPGLPEVPSDQPPLRLPAPRSGGTRRRREVEDAKVDVRRLLCVVLEVLDGRRPVVQLNDLFSDTALRAVSRQVRLTGRGSRPARLGRVHTSSPAPGAIEVAATISRGRRVHAVAARLELRGKVWTCTAFHVLP